MSAVVDMMMKPILEIDLVLFIATGIIIYSIFR